MSLSKKIITGFILAPALFLSVVQGQTKKYINFLRTDTLNGKLSINLPYHQSKIDSLQKILKSNKTENLIFIKKELKEQEFIIKYENYILTDKLDKAKLLVESHLNSEEAKEETIFGEKRLYERYQKDLQQRFKDQDENLLELIQNKRDFKKKFKETISKTPSLDSYIDARDLSIRCKTYAQRNNLKNPSYVEYYGRYASAKILDESTSVDLEKSTKRKSNLNKILKPYFESEDMKEYLKAVDLLDTLFMYVKISPKSKVKIRDLKEKRYELSRLIQKEQEYLNYDSLASRSNKYGVTQFRNDSLNPEGIFEFNDKIVVIVDYNSEYSSIRFKLAEGVAKADKFLVRYADENDNSEKHSKANEIVRGGSVIPYFIDGQKQPYFNVYDFYQVRVSYDYVRNKRFTKKLKNTLRPIEIDTNYYGLVHEFYDVDSRIRFYRNNEGSFLDVNTPDSAVIISEYDDKKNSNTDKETHFIDKVQIYRKKKRKTIFKEYTFNEQKGVPKDKMLIFKKYSTLFRKYYSLSKKFF